MKEQEEDTEFARMMERVNKTKRELRTKDLAKGHSFMSFASHLPSDQAIYEYPDGRFEVLRITGVLAPAEFIRLATTEEIVQLKKNNPAYPEFYL